MTFCSAPQGTENFKLYSASRTDPLVAWENVQELSGINSNIADADPALFHDSLSIIWSSRAPNNKSWDLVEVSRSDPSTLFPMRQLAWTLSIRASRSAIPGCRKTEPISCSAGRQRAAPASFMKHGGDVELAIDRLTTSDYSALQLGYGPRGKPGASCCRRAGALVRSERIGPDRAGVDGADTRRRGHAHILGIHRTVGTQRLPRGARGWPRRLGRYRPGMLDRYSARPAQVSCRGRDRAHTNRIALRASIAARKRARNREQRQNALAEQSPVPNFAGSEDVLPNLWLVRALIDELSAVQAETVLMRMVLGCSVEEIAVATQVPVNTTKSRLRLAKDYLRRRLDGEMVGCKGSA